MITGLHKAIDRAWQNLEGSPSLAKPPLKLALAILLLVAIGWHISPFSDVQGRVFWQFISEDGYLMQTVARNIALGLGMSTAQGTIPTNGVQPLATFLYAGLHFLAGGSKLAGIALVIAFSTVVVATAAYFAYKVALQLFSGLKYGRELAFFAAAAWFASPRIISQSLNGLETGVYYLAIFSALHFYLVATRDENRPMGWRERLVLGFLLGVVFLARNDAVFFIAAVLFAHLVLGGNAASGGFSRRLTDCLIAGLVSVAVGLPWLVNNYLLFGSIVPISGLAESHGEAFGRNLALIPAGLVKAAFLYVPIPQSLETKPLVILLATGGIATAFGGYWLLAGRFALALRRFLLAGTVFTAAIVIYYGLFFGAPHFVPRYLSALSPFLWFGTVASVCVILGLVCRRHQTMQLAMLVIVLVMAVETAAFAWRSFSQARSHMHRQVVEWVAGNVPDDQWVGAIQTGTLGYFHDRTINLDGKVNPTALRARIQDGNVLNYVVDSKITYLADWVGITGWAMGGESARFSESFTVVVRDEQRNLGVLKRVGTIDK